MLFNLTRRYRTGKPIMLYVAFVALYKLDQIIDFYQDKVNSASLCMPTWFFETESLLYIYSY